MFLPTGNCMWYFLRHVSDRHTCINTQKDEQAAVITTLTWVDEWSKKSSLPVPVWSYKSIFSSSFWCWQQFTVQKCLTKLLDLFLVLVFFVRMFVRIFPCLSVVLTTVSCPDVFSRFRCVVYFCIPLFVSSSRVVALVIATSCFLFWQCLWFLCFGFNFVSCVCIYIVYAFPLSSSHCGLCLSVQCVLFRPFVWLANVSFCSFC